MTAATIPLAVTLASAVLLWLASLRIKNASIIDIWWGPAIALCADLAALLGPPARIGGALPLILINLWAIRLGGHIWQRHRGEDYRYATMREKFGRHWWWWSLVQVFLLQGLLVWLVSWPLLAVATAGPARLGLVEITGMVLAAGGLILEAIADWQLTRFRADAANRNKVLDSGVWAWSRHPNYFGDTMMWWGFFLAALGMGAPWWVIESPLIMTVLLLKVSGVALLEDTIADRRPGYADYVRRTSAFIPWPPKRG